MNDPTIARRAGACALFAALLIAALPAAAQIVPSAPPDSVTQHTLDLRGTPIPYTARAGTLDLKDATGGVGARIFYVAYTKNGASAGTRPITFFYNGGPDDSTMMLHMASFAPVRMPVANAKAEAKLVQNQFSLLDATDMVFVDAPNTGYSRVYGNPRDYIGVDEDGRAFADFIAQYLTHFKRAGSPTFLFGESYGTTRSCVVGDLLVKRGIALRGIVLLSSVITQMNGGDWTYSFYLPSEAAVAWSFHKTTNEPSDLDALIARASAFATGEYLHALAAGDTLGATERQHVLTELHDLTGLSTSYISQRDLRIPYQDFRRGLLRDRGLITGRYDARTADPVLKGKKTQPDPATSHISPTMTKLLAGYMRNVLRYTPPITYRPYATRKELGAPWDQRHDGAWNPYNVATDLADAMKRDPKMLVFSANGRFDFATSFTKTRYVLNHLFITPEVQKNVSFKLYPSGHMVYFDPQARVQFYGDLERWYAQALDT